MTLQPAVAPVERLTCTYTACYCEENVFHLLQRLISLEGRPQEDLYAVFISNSNEMVPFWMQKASRQTDGLVIWDYHVLVLEIKRKPVTEEAEALVWDLDTLLPFPCTFQEYTENALRAGTVALSSQYQRCYRLIAADTFLQHFASDRSHMRLPNGRWSAEPPSYPCIVAKDGCTNNLHCYRDVLSDTLETQVADRNDLVLAEEGGAAMHDCDGQHGSLYTYSNGGRSSRTSGVLVNWDLMSALARSSRFGVVVNEQQLLDALERHMRGSNK